MTILTLAALALAPSAFGQEGDVERLPPQIYNVTPQGDPIEEFAAGDLPSGDVRCDPGQVPVVAGTADRNPGGVTAQRRLDLARAWAITHPDDRQAVEDGGMQFRYGVAYGTTVTVGRGAVWCANPSEIPELAGETVEFAAGLSELKAATEDLGGQVSQNRSDINDLGQAFGQFGSATAARFTEVENELGDLDRRVTRIERRPDSGPNPWSLSVGAAYWRGGMRYGAAGLTAAVEFDSTHEGRFRSRLGLRAQGFIGAYNRADMSVSTGWSIAGTLVLTDTVEFVLGGGNTDGWNKLNRKAAWTNPGFVLGVSVEPEDTLLNVFVGTTFGPWRLVEGDLKEAPWVVTPMVGVSRKVR